MTSAPLDDFPPDDLDARRLVAPLAAALRAGKSPSDLEFDVCLPDDLRALSSRHFTPVRVASLVGKWLDELNVSSLVDIGSGAGKLCVVAALVARRCQVVGFEQRPGLVAASRSLADQFGLGDRVTFVEGVLGEAELPRADAYYLFNPFGENLFGPLERIDNDVEAGDERYERDVSEVEAALLGSPPGTFVITFNGFGGRIPDDFEVVRVDREFPGVVRMWQKARLSAA